MSTLFSEVQFNWRPTAERLRKISIHDPDFVASRIPEVFYYIHVGSKDEKIAAAETMLNLIIQKKDIAKSEEILSGLICEANNVDMHVRHKLIQAAGRSAPMMCDKTRNILLSRISEVVSLLEYDPITSMWAQPVIKQISIRNPNPFRDHTKCIANTVYRQDQMLATDAIGTLYLLGEKNPNHITRHLNDLLYFLRTANEMLRYRVLPPIGLIGISNPEALTNTGFMKILESMMINAEDPSKIQAIRTSGVLLAHHPNQYISLKPLLIKQIDTTVDEIQKEAVLALMRSENQPDTIAKKSIRPNKIDQLIEKHDLEDVNVVTETSIKDEAELYINR